MTKPKDATEIRKDLIATCGHDIRSLSFSNNGLAHLLLKRKKESGGDKKEIETLERMIHAGDRALMEVKSLIGFLKLEQVEKYATPTSVEAATLLEDINEELAPFLNEKKLNLDITIEDELPPIFCSTTTIKEVLHHLLFAAIELSDKNAALIIEVSEDQNEKHLLFSIRYSGTTISEEAQGELFEKPLVINKFTHSLALPLCYEYIREEGGVLAYEVISEGFSRFLVTFPVFDPEHLSS